MNTRIVFQVLELIFKVLSVILGKGAIVASNLSNKSKARIA